MTPTNDADVILQKANIADVIGRYIEVQKKGNSYVAVCPFHDDSSPSLNISVDKKIFKCFACGVGGNVLTFVQRLKSLSFPETLAEVGKLVGVEVRTFAPAKQKYSTIQEKIISINEAAMNYFSTMLFTKDGKHAREYLESRKISLKDIRSYNIGFAKSRYDLYDYLHDVKKFSIKEIEESVLFRKKGLTYLPTFFNRLIFPIRDFDGSVIGFSGRVIEKVEGVPKYLNTSENVIFKKSHLAYNFSNAESSIRVKDEIIILEGYMDVISLNRVDIKNVVAIMGTSLSEHQVNEFKKVTRNFTIFLDGDEPGINATLKLIKQISHYDINIKVVLNKTGLDPDELIKAGDKNKVVDMIAQKKHPTEFAIEIAKLRIEKNNSFESKDLASKMFFEVLNLEQSETHISNSLKIFSEVIGSSEESVKIEFEKFCESQPKQKKVISNSKNKNTIEKNYLNEVSHAVDESIDMMQGYNADDFENVYSEDEQVYVEDVYISQHNPVKTILKVDDIKIPTLNNLDSALAKILIGVLDKYEIIDRNTSAIATLEPKVYSLIDTIWKIQKENPEFGRNEILNELQNEKYKNHFSLLQKIFRSNLKANYTKKSMSKIIGDSLKAIEKYNIVKDVADLDELISIRMTRIETLQNNEPKSGTPEYEKWLVEITDERIAADKLFKSQNKLKEKVGK